MGLQHLLNSAQASGNTDYLYAFTHLGHSILLGILLMMLTIWVTRKIGNLQSGAKDSDDSSPINSVRGAVNVLFFCFGMTGVMLLVEDNIARAFAIGAAIALVRFRTNMANRLSSAFLFSIVIGMACGLGKTPIAWFIAALYTLVTVIITFFLTSRRFGNQFVPNTDVTPGQLIRNAEGNWVCHFPRYMAIVDGGTGDLISLQVRGDELIKSVKPQSDASTKGFNTSSITVSEFESHYAKRCGLHVSHPHFSLWWHFLADAVIVEYMAASDSQSEMTVLFNRNLSGLSQPYPAQNRHLPSVVRKESEQSVDTGVSAVTRGGTPVVLYSSDLKAFEQPAAKNLHGVILSGDFGARYAVEIQIGPAASSMPIPIMS